MRLKKRVRGLEKRLQDMETEMNQHKCTHSGAKRYEIACGFTAGYVELCCDCGLSLRIISWEQAYKLMADG